LVLKAGLLVRAQQCHGTIKNGCEASEGDLLLEPAEEISLGRQIDHTIRLRRERAIDMSHCKLPPEQRNIGISILMLIVVSRTFSTKRP
jgi:hypothetical protein